MFTTRTALRFVKEALPLAWDFDIDLTEAALTWDTHTLALAIDNAGEPGLADVFFEDSEGSAASFGCTDVVSSPVLHVSASAAGYNVFLPLINR